jgi:hypothetical protein
VRAGRAKAGEEKGKGKEKQEGRGIREDGGTRWRKSDRYKRHSISPPQPLQLLAGVDIE